MKLIEKSHDFQIKKSHEQDFKIKCSQIISRKKHCAPSMLLLSISNDEFMMKPVEKKKLNRQIKTHAKFKNIITNPYKKRHGMNHIITESNKLEIEKEKIENTIKIKHNN